MLAPPPRRVPWSIKLAVRFGHPVTGLGAWLLTAFLLLPVLLQLKQALGGFSYQPGVPWITQLLGVGFPIFCLLLLVVLFAITIKAGTPDIRLLENGRLGYARLVKKTKLNAPEESIFRLRFEYEVAGTKYKAWMDNPVRMKRLEDDALEPILYDGTNPGRSVLMDALSAYISTDRNGGLIDRLPIAGFLYLMIPVTLSAVFIYIIFSKG